MSIKSILLRGVVTLGLVLNSSGGYVSADVEVDKAYRIGFFIPDDTPFWSRVALFATAAAADLNIELTVFDADADRIRMTNQFRHAQEKSSHYDALIFPNFLKTALVALEGCERQKIPCILYNGDLDAEATAIMGVPGGASKNWIAQLIPDDTGSAEALARSLMLTAEARVDMPITMVAINGFRADSPAIKREQGLRQALEGFPNVVLKQVFYTDWSEEDAYHRARGIFPRYPNVKIIWSANYRTTNGILKALNEVGRLPGKDILVNSYDIDPISLGHVANGAVAVTAGGHYVEGAWSVIIAYDYLKGHRLSASEAVVHTPLLLVTKENLTLVRTALIQLEEQPETLHRADFTHFSLVNKPHLQQYEFSLERVLSEMHAQRDER